MTTSNLQLTVEFQIMYIGLLPGADVFISGSHPALGQWVPEQALPLKYDVYNHGRWFGSVTMPAGSLSQWKVITRDVDSQVTRWEERANRDLQLNYNVASVTLYSSWNGQTHIAQVPTYCLAHTGKFYDPPEMVNVGFTTSYNIESPNETLAVVGSIHGLGCWEPERVLYLRRLENTTKWGGSVMIPVGCKFEWKFVVMDTRQPQVRRWETYNRHYTARPFDCQLFANWDAPAAELSYFCDCSIYELNKFFQKPDSDSDDTDAKDAKISTTKVISSKKSALKVAPSNNQMSSTSIGPKKSVHFDDDVQYQEPDDYIPSDYLDWELDWEWDWGSADEDDSNDQDTGKETTSNGSFTQPDKYSPDTVSTVGPRLNVAMADASDAVKCKEKDDLTAVSNPTVNNTLENIAKAAGSESLENKSQTVLNGSNLLSAELEQMVYAHYQDMFKDPSTDDYPLNDEHEDNVAHMFPSNDAFPKVEIASIAIATPNMYADDKPFSDGVINMESHVGKELNDTGSQILHSHLETDIDVDVTGKSDLRQCPSDDDMARSFLSRWDSKAVYITTITGAAALLGYAVFKAVKLFH